MRGCQGQIASSPASAQRDSSYRLIVSGLDGFGSGWATIQASSSAYISG